MSIDWAAEANDACKRYADAKAVNLRSNALMAAHLLSDTCATILSDPGPEFLDLLEGRVSLSAADPQLLKDVRMAARNIHGFAAALRASTRALPENGPPWFDQPCTNLKPSLESMFFAAKEITQMIDAGTRSVALVDNLCSVAHEMDQHLWE